MLTGNRPMSFAALDDKAIEAALQQPLVPDEKGVFQLGIVLNGTVSAGAWTAGVLDYMTEALDLWEAKKAEDLRRGGVPTVPDHELRIGVLGGASGGGVCAAIFARAAGWDFLHVSRADDPRNAQNPYWRVWVDGLDIAPMLKLDDVDRPGETPVSLLSGAAIDAAGDVILQWPGRGGTRRQRRWIADPLRVVLTLTNLRGIPYQIEFAPDGEGGGQSSFYVDHADHAIFAFPSGGAAPAGLRGDEHAVLDTASWQEFASYAKATGAFPGGFPARRLFRPASDYRWRGVVLPGGAGEPAKIVLRKPAWDAFGPEFDREGLFEFECVDGGALNNQPVELVRTALSGLGGTNERRPERADKAVLLLDPFAAVPRCETPAGTRDVLGVLGGLISAWTDHGRLATSDLLLAVQPEVFSRFLLTASSDRGGERRHGGAALASSGLGAFLGFLRRELRAHDFMLGRENCRLFLMNQFVLHKDNPVMRGFAARHPGVASEFQPGERGPDWVPVVPVAEHLRAKQIVPAWPAGALDPATLEHGIEARAGQVLRRLLEHHDLDIPLDKLVIDWLFARKLANVAEAQIRGALSKAGLG